MDLNPKCLANGQPEVITVGAVVLAQVKNRVGRKQTLTHKLVGRRGISPAHL